MIFGTQNTLNYVNLLPLCANALCVIARRHDEAIQRVGQFHSTGLLRSSQ